MSINKLDINGLTTKAYTDVVNAIENGEPGYPGLYQIYGSGINLNPNSPDANLVNIFALACVDTAQLAAQIYTSMDPDQAVGVTLDSRCAINGVIREGGTFTQQPISVTFTQAITLPGIDLYPNNPFSVSDGTNVYQLISTVTSSGASTVSLNFQAQQIGPIQSAVNTITTIVTVTFGVSAVNNPNTYTYLGVTTETDAALRIRRANSVSLPSKGYLAGLYGALLDITGITYALVLENYSNTTDSNGIPSHSIWCIVSGTNNATIQGKVANAIYVKRNAGCGMKGSITSNVTQVDGSTFVVQFDYSTLEPLYFTCTATAIDSTKPLDKSAIQLAVYNRFANAYGINQTADATSIVAFIKNLYPNASITAEGIYTTGGSGSPVATLAPVAVNYQFNIPAQSNVHIN
jgi:hypothetical protein